MDMSAHCFPMQHTYPPLPFANTYVDQHDAGLLGAQGAEAIVNLLRKQRSIEHLVLGHNSLGDAGCVALFDYLRSEEGKIHKLLEISLNANDIGDAGLWAIARYLEYNKSLNALFLQNNLLQGEPPIMFRFALAVNRSNLRTLSLTCNRSLGDAIRDTFLPNLSAPRLAELHLSVCSLEPSATPALLSYLTSPRSSGLHTLKLNGNPLGLPSVKRLIHALEVSNWSLVWVEMHACCLNGASGGNDGWRQCEEQLGRGVLERNRFLARKAGADALALLPHARPALLYHGRQVNGTSSRLPPELVIHILSFLAPALSAAQHLRVCTYAASPSTLPSLQLSIPSSSHSPFSAFRESSLRNVIMGGASAPGRVHSRPVSSSSEWAQMTFLPKNEDLKTWLRRVGCDRFEPDPRVEFDEGLTQDESDQSSEEVSTGGH